MYKQTGTWKSGWKISALIAVLCLGAATLTEAQEEKPNKSIGEIQAEIDRLQAELRKAKAGETNTEENTASYWTNMLPGSYLGMEGDDRIGIVIEKPKDGVYPITFYEDGLPGAGYDPNDDDKYIGTAVLGSVVGGGKIGAVITLKQKFDGLREEPVEPALRELKAVMATRAGKNGAVARIAIPKNREWNAVLAEKEMPATRNTASVPTTVLPPGVDALAGRYWGYEGDDRMGMVLTPSKQEAGHLDVVFYEDGLPGAGHDPNDDDRYEGTAVLKGNTLEIRLSKKFDEGREKRIERALRNLTATVDVDTEGKVKVAIPRNAEWDDVSLEKSK